MSHDRGSGGGFSCQWSWPTKLIKEVHEMIRTNYYTYIILPCGITGWRLEGTYRCIKHPPLRHKAFGDWDMAVFLCYTLQVNEKRSKTSDIHNVQQSKCVAPTWMGRKALTPTSKQGSSRIKPERNIFLLYCSSYLYHTRNKSCP